MQHDLHGVATINNLLAVLLVLAFGVGGVGFFGFAGVVFFPSANY